MTNRLLGKRKRTLWCEGYDSPIVIMPLRALVAITYIYSNPAKDNVTESINEDEGFSSWDMFTSGNHTETYKRLYRTQFEFVPNWRQNSYGYKEEADSLLSESSESCTLMLTPNAWQDAIGITDKVEQEKWNTRIKERIKVLEDRAAKVRKREGRRVI